MLLAQKSIALGPFLPHQIVSITTLLQLNLAPKVHMLQTKLALFVVEYCLPLKNYKAGLERLYRLHCKFLACASAS